MKKENNLPTPERKVKPKKLSELTAKKKTAMAVIQAIKDKLAGLKHGYMVNDELKALEDLIESLK